MLARPAFTPTTATTNMCNTSQQPFAARELRRALAEQSFGIKDFCLGVTTSSLQATASVTLLEGGVIIISLSNRGYHLDTNAKTYESVEQLLQAVSPLYTQRLQETLLSKLSRLA